MTTIVRLAEGIPAQALRACDECDAVFVMNLDEKPRYVKATA